MSQFSDRLRELRLEAGNTQAEVAKVIGVSVQSYSAYETGREPKYDMLMKLCVYFNVSANYLTGLSNAKYAENTIAVDSLGLSELAIEALKAMRQEYPTSNYAGNRTIDDVSLSFSDILSILILSKKFKPFLETLLLQAIMNVSGFIDGVGQLTLPDNRSISIDYRQLTQLELLDILDSFVKELENEQNR